MVKSYTSADNTFSGSNKFEENVSCNSNRIIGMTPPALNFDAANKAYVDGVNVSGVSSSSTSTFGASSSSIHDMVSISVTVAAGQTVLLLCTIEADGEDSGDESQAWFRRATTDLNYDGYSQIYSILDMGGGGDWANQNGSMQYFDTSPGTGTITYRVRGFEGGSSNLAGRFTVIVFN